MPEIAQMASALRNHSIPIGFMDLPLEIRQEVYTQVLPSNRVMNFPLHLQSLAERATFAVCASVRDNDALYTEIESWIYKNCTARLTISPEWAGDLPTGIEWDRFQRLEIVIQHLEDDDCRVWPGLTQAINSLRPGRIAVLPAVSIEFEEDKHLCSEDDRWTDTVPARHAFFFTGWFNVKDPASDDGFMDREDRMEDYLYELQDGGEPYPDELYYNGEYYGSDVWLRVPAGCSEPTVTAILDRFLALPRCRSAVVRPLSYLQPRRVGAPEHSSRVRIFDDRYMTDLCDALGFWLDGSKRDGVNRLDGEDVFGVPALEQLAYMEWEGGLYCGGGRSHLLREMATCADEED